MKILFVCRANVGRSQMAETIFNKLTQGVHTATSAGTKVPVEGEKLKDRHFAENVIVVLEEMGIDAKENMSNQVTPELVEAADKVFVMAEKDTIPEWLMHDPKMVYWQIKDALDHDISSTRAIRDDIATKIKEFLKSQ